MRQENRKTHHYHNEKLTNVGNIKQQQHEYEYFKTYLNAWCAYVLKCRRMRFEQPTRYDNDNNTSI